MKGEAGFIANFVADVAYSTNIREEELLDADFHLADKLAPRSISPASSSPDRPVGDIAKKETLDESLLTKHKRHD